MYLSFFLFSFCFSQGSARTAKSIFNRFSVSFFKLSVGLVVWPRFSVPVVFLLLLFFTHYEFFARIITDKTRVTTRVLKTLLSILADLSSNVLYSHKSSSHFLSPQSLFLVFCDSSEDSNLAWYHHDLHFLHFSLSVCLSVCLSLSLSLSRKALLLSIYSLWPFHIGFNWWFYAEVWETANLLRSPRLFKLIPLI